MNWFKRYINLKYDDFWTLTLDKLFKVNPQNRITILNYGSEFLTPIITNCKYNIIKKKLVTKLTRLLMRICDLP